jgi:hypothetical protein
LKAGDKGQPARARRGAARLAIDVLSVAAFGVALFFLGTAVMEREWLLAGLLVVGLFLGMRASAALCERHGPSAGPPGEG